MCSCHTNLWLILIVILIPILLFSVFHLIAVIFGPYSHVPGKISIQSLRDKDKKE